MSVEENKRKCLEMVAAWNRWELAGIIDHWAEDVVHYARNRPVPVDEVVRRMEAGLAAFPDLRLEVDSIIAEGDRVSLRISATATHSGPLGSQAPTNAPVSWEFVEEVRFVDGKVVEHWDVTDSLPMLKALGRAPTLG